MRPGGAPGGRRTLGATEVRCACGADVRQCQASGSGMSAPHGLPQGAMTQLSVGAEDRGDQEPDRRRGEDRHRRRTGDAGRRSETSTRPGPTPCKHTRRSLKYRRKDWTAAIRHDAYDRGGSRQRGDRAPSTRCGLLSRWKRNCSRGRRSSRASPRCTGGGEGMKPGGQLKRDRPLSRGTVTLQPGKPLSRNAPVARASEKRAAGIVAGAVKTAARGRQASPARREARRPHQGRLRRSGASAV